MGEQPSIKFLQPMDSFDDKGSPDYIAQKEAFFEGDVAANFNAIA